MPVRVWGLWGVQVKAVSRLYHRNLVRLLGYCSDHMEQVLVYEYVPNGPLFDHLYGTIKGKPSTAHAPLASFASGSFRFSHRIAAPCPCLLRCSCPGQLLSFEQGVGAAIGLAEGLVYLHNHTERPTVRRDIKPSNVLLTHDYQVGIRPLPSPAAWAMPISTVLPRPAPHRALVIQKASSSQSPCEDSGLGVVEGGGQGGDGHVHQGGGHTVGELPAVPLLEQRHTGGSAINLSWSQEGSSEGRRMGDSGSWVAKILGRGKQGTAA
ncbi:unnamed protein product [Closterium sp. Naga37s-1]|nr:unnamed protein product [Closterium sp. Naga37s-1]